MITVLALNLAGDGLRDFLILAQESAMNKVSASLLDVNLSVEIASTTIVDRLCLQLSEELFMALQVSQDLQMTALAVMGLLPDSALPLIRPAGWS